MRYHSNPYRPGTREWNSQQVQNQLLNSQRRRREEQRRRDFLNSQERWREEQRRRDLQIWAQRRRHAGGQGSSAGWWILPILGAVVALVIILSNIT
jgi:hypothetical protein